MAQRTVRGFAWLVYPRADPTADHFEPGRPFEGEELPPGVIDFWPADTDFGLGNERSGDTLLVITKAPEAPRVRATYKAAPLPLTEGYQAGGGLVRLRRILGEREIGGERVQEGEFEADEDLPIASM
ncbi:MAG: hypothetical protein IRY99_22435 [Isosphaeraceae bacterium]|nr:hypothetical protein [Isosphaeraceae bacterium]